MREGPFPAMAPVRAKCLAFGPAAASWVSGLTAQFREESECHRG